MNETFQSTQTFPSTYLTSNTSHSEFTCTASFNPENAYKLFDNSLYGLQVFGEDSEYTNGQYTGSVERIPFYKGHWVEITTDTPIYLETLEIYPFLYEKTALPRILWAFGSNDGIHYTKISTAFKSFNWGTDNQFNTVISKTIDEYTDIPYTRHLFILNKVSQQLYAPRHSKWQITAKTSSFTETIKLNNITGDINLTGGLSVNGATGTSGQVLTSSGGGAMSWTTVSGGSGSSVWTNTSSATALHPTVTMTSASMGGYVASASSFSGLGPVYHAFNNIIGAESWLDGYGTYTGSPTGTYTGHVDAFYSTTYNGSTTVDGEWIQLQVPTSITIKLIKIAPENNRSLNAPTEGKILGSTNGSTWTLIHSFTGQTYTDGQYTTISFSNSVAYSYFRLVIERTGGGSGAGPGACKIGELKFGADDDGIYHNTGNVGIGTTTPAYKLDVDGDINVSTGSSFRVNGVAQTSPWTTSGSNIYRSSGQVNIGGSTFTRAKLEINGSYSSYLIYRYYAYGSYGQMASGTNSYGIYCNARIAADEFNAHSDIRIKKNITDINDSSALDKIRLLEPKIYNYIDEKVRGTSNVYVSSLKKSQTFYRTRLR